MRTLWTALVLAVVATAAADEPAPRLKLVATIDGASPSQYAPLAFSPDGKLLASSDQRVTKESGEINSSVKVWDVARRKAVATLRGDTGVSDHGFFTVAFGPGGKTLAVGGHDLTFLDVDTWKVKTLLKDRGAAAFSPDGRMFAANDVGAGPSSTDVTLGLWEVATGQRRATIKIKVRDRAGLFSSAFSPDGKLFACGTGTSGSEGLPNGGEVILWDLAAGRPRATLKGKVRLRLPLRSLARLHKDEGVPKRVTLKLIALNGIEVDSEQELEKQLPAILDKLLGKEDRAKYLKAVERHLDTQPVGMLSWVWALAFSPDGKTLASGDVYGNVVVWDVQTGKRKLTLQRFNVRGREKDINGVFALAFSPDGKLLAAGTTHGIALWDARTGEVAVSPGRPAAWVWALAFSPDGKTLASAGTRRVPDLRDRPDDGPVLRLWRLVPAPKADE